MWQYANLKMEYATKKDWIRERTSSPASFRYLFIRKVAPSRSSFHSNWPAWISCAISTTLISYIWIFLAALRLPVALYTGWVSLAVVAGTAATVAMLMIALVLVFYREANLLIPPD